MRQTAHQLEFARIGRNERKHRGGRTPGPNPRIRHRSREPFAGRFPCHVTLKVREGVPIAAHGPTGPRGRTELRFFFKQPVGPGWALVGDSGLHLDPTPGLGISDAFRDAIALSEAIVGGSELAFARYWRRRDADSIGLYRMAADMGSEGYSGPFTELIYRRAQASPAMRQRLLSVLDRECRAQDMLPAGRLVAWLASEVAHGRFRSFSGFGRALRRALALGREQARFDRELATLEDGHSSAAERRPVPATA